MIKAISDGCAVVLWCDNSEKSRDGNGDDHDDEPGRADITNLR